MNKDIVIRIENVSKTFYVKENAASTIRDALFDIFKNTSMRSIHSLRNVNLEVPKGSITGIVGRNGSGKSTLLKLIAGAYLPDKGGKIEVEGKLIRLALGMGFDVNLSARDNIYVNGSMLGLTFRQIGSKFKEIIDFAELQAFVDTKVKFYSSGMLARLAFSIAMHAEADILLIDEFFGGVGDENFRQKSQKVFEEIMLGNERTVVLVSHDLNVIQSYCDNILLLDRGHMIGYGHPTEMIPIYLDLMNKEGVGAN